MNLLKKATNFVELRVCWKLSMWMERGRILDVLGKSYFCPLHVEKCPVILSEKWKNPWKLGLCRMLEKITGENALEQIC